MLVELHPKSYQATLYMKAGDRITQTTTGGETPDATAETGKYYIAPFFDTPCLLLKPI